MRNFETHQLSWCAVDPNTMFSFTPTGVIYTSFVNDSNLYFTRVELIQYY